MLDFFGNEPLMSTSALEVLKFFHTMLETSVSKRWEEEGRVEKSRFSSMLGFFGDDSLASSCRN